MQILMHLDMDLKEIMSVRNIFGQLEFFQMALETPLQGFSPESWNLLTLNLYMVCKSDVTETCKQMLDWRDDCE